MTAPIDCPRARTWMTPCVARDGRTACADDGVCVGCGHHPANLLTDLVRQYVDLRNRIVEVRPGPNEPGMHRSRS